MTISKASGRWGHVFTTSASPINRFSIKKLAMSPSSTVHGGEHESKYVAIELLLHAVFVADEIEVLCLNELV